MPAAGAPGDGRGAAGLMRPAAADAWRPGDGANVGLEHQPQAGRTIAVVLEQWAAFGLLVGTFGGFSPRRGVTVRGRTGSILTLSATAPAENHHPHGAVSSIFPHQECTIKRAARAAPVSSIG